MLIEETWSCRDGEGFDRTGRPLSSTVWGASGHAQSSRLDAGDVEGIHEVDTKSWIYYGWEDSLAWFVNSQESRGEDSCGFRAPLEGSSVAWHKRATFREFQKCPVQQSVVDRLVEAALARDAFPLDSPWRDIIQVHFVSLTGSGDRWSPGIYAVGSQSAKLSSGVDRLALCRVFYGLRSYESCAGVLVWSLDLELLASLGNESALRHAWIYLGFLNQRVIGVCLEHGLGTLPTPAIQESAMMGLLNHGASYLLPSYSLAFGLPKSLRAPSDTR